MPGRAWLPNRPYHGTMSILHLIDCMSTPARNFNHRRLVPFALLLFAVGCVCNRAPAGPAPDDDARARKTVSELARTDPMTDEAAHQLFEWAGQGGNSVDPNAAPEGRYAVAQWQAAREAIRARSAILYPFARRWIGWKPPREMKDSEKIGALLERRYGAAYCVAVAEGR